LSCRHKTPAISALYHQLLSGLCAKRTQKLLPRTDGYEPKLLAKPFQGNSAVQTRKKMMEEEEGEEAVKFQQKTDINFFIILPF
jgi:hypothetical protein